MKNEIFIVESFNDARCPMRSIVGAYINKAAAEACATTDGYNVEAIAFRGEAKRGAKVFIIEEYSHERIPDLEYTEAYSNETEAAAVTKTCPTTLDSVSYCTVALK